MSKNDGAEKWYYDACALDYDKNTFGEILSGKKVKRSSFAGNLSIGEAYGSSFRKKGKEAADAFLKLMRQLNAVTAKGFTVFEIIDHKEINKIFFDIRDEFPLLDLTDSIHLATAIKNNCNILRTADSGLYNLPKDKIKKIAEKYSVSNFAITKMN